MCPQKSILTNTMLPLVSLTFHCSISWIGLYVQTRNLWPLSTIKQVTSWQKESHVWIPILFHLRFWQVSRIAISISSFLFFWLGWVDFNQVRFARSGLERESTYLLGWIKFLVVYLSKSIYLVLVEIFLFWLNLCWLYLDDNIWFGFGFGFEIHWFKMPWFEIHLF